MLGRSAHHAVIAGLVLAYVAVWAASPLVLGQTSDLDVFFWPSAETAAHGHPLMIYSTNTVGQGSNDNGPLGLLPLVPLAVVANRMGWASDVVLRTGITDAIFAVFTLLLAATAVRIIGRSRGALEWRLGAPCVFLLSPALWISVGDYGHLEHPIELWLVVMAVAYTARHRSISAGIALGLAVLTRTTALLYIIPFALLPLVSRRMRPTTTVLSVSALVAAIGFAPFLLADGASVVHSLVTYRSDLPIAGGSFWLIARGSSWAGLAQYGQVSDPCGGDNPDCRSLVASTCRGDHDCRILRPAYSDRRLLPNARQNDVSLLLARAIRVCRDMVAHPTGQCL